AISCSAMPWWSRTPASRCCAARRASFSKCQHETRSTTMRRGLIAHSKVELPDAAFDARQARLRAAMAGLDALLVYTNNTRPAGVSWLVGFIPYWSEAMLVLPRSG